MDESNLALLLLRVVVGITLAAHGVNKAKGLDGVASWFDSMGMRPGKLHARAAAGGEILSGLFLAFGILTSFAALGFVALMTVAFYTTHRRNGFFILDEGWEYVMVLGIIAVSIAMIGPGEWSIDNAIGIDTDLDGYVGLAISAVGGVAAATALLAVYFRPPEPTQD